MWMHISTDRGCGRLMSPNEFGLPTPDEILGNKPKEKSKKRDRRRSFTRTQKNEILYQQDNKCAVCHNKLDPRATEFDHEKPWASGGRTVIANDRAYVQTAIELLPIRLDLRKLIRKERQRRKRKISEIWDLMILFDYEALI